MGFGLATLPTPAPPGDDEELRTIQKKGAVQHPRSFRAENWYCRFRRQRTDRRSTKPFWVSCHDVITGCKPCRCRCHRILEVRTRQLQGFLYDGAIDCRYSKDS